MNAMPTFTPRTPEAIERLARKRAGARMGWYVHAAVYVVVNTALVLLSLATGKHWAIFPALGWGLGLALHGGAVWLAMGGGGLQQRLIDQERARLTAQRDPW
jgi:2TM domain